MERAAAAVEDRSAGGGDSGGHLSVRWRSITAAGRAHPLVVDIALTVMVAVVSAPWMLHANSTDGAWTLMAALVVPLIWRRRFPVGVFVVLSAVALAQWIVGDRLVADISLLAALYTVAELRPRRIALAAATLLEVGVVMATFRWTLDGSWLRTLVFLSTMAVAALLLGANVRGRRAYLASLIDRAERLEHERDQQAQLAAVAERTRIAREMHDVLAHSLAVIIALADGAAVKVDREPARAAAAISQVSEIGRQSLRDTRRLLGVLRSDDTPDPTGPQPDISQLADLIAGVGATGIDVTLGVTGDPFPIPPGGELTVYRIVQEALTNTLKHAGRARSAEVCLRYLDCELEVEVSNDGTRAAPPLGALQGTHRRGHGLAGMRERAAVYQGTVEAGPRPGGGWRVLARLPMGPGSSP